MNIHRANYYSCFLIVRKHGKFVHAENNVKRRFEVGVCVF